MKKDPKLLERRVKGGMGHEPEKNQKRIQFMALISFFTVFLFSATDHRLGWSKVDWCVVATGDILVILGYLTIFFTFKENTFASALIERSMLDRRSSPQALMPLYVTHSMPASWSCWSACRLRWDVVGPLHDHSHGVGADMGRLREEERFLAKNLPGYTEYQNQVKDRLVPRLW